MSFLRSILIPSLLVFIIASPILFSESNVQPGSEPAQWDPENANTSPFLTASAPSAPRSNSRKIPFTVQAIPGPNPTTDPDGLHLMPQNPATRSVPFGLASSARPVTDSFPNMANDSSGNPVNAQNMVVPSMNTPPGSFPPQFPTDNGLLSADMIPDFGAAQTLVFPGNAYGPDLSAQPLEFMPVTDLREIFRFDIAPNWIRSRWERVSVPPTEDGLSGMRVALVTGTNSWDLHGALTYYFDSRKRLQRITFRGWSGDETRLVQLLTQSFHFKSQPTNLAGFYLSKSWGKQKGALLMKYPPVIDRTNPNQQIGMVLEINNPASGFSISEDMQSLILGSHPE